MKDLLEGQLKDFQKNLQEVLNNQVTEMVKSQKEVVDAVKLQLEDTMKSERTKRKQRIQYFEVEDDEEEEEVITRKKWRPSRYQCKKCGKMVATNWKNRHDANYCKPGTKTEEDEPSVSGRLSPGIQSKLRGKLYSKR